jgi:hypothetical protein
VLCAHLQATDPTCFARIAANSSKMASAAPKTVASLPLFTVVALCGFITEVLMRLLNGVAGEAARQITVLQPRVLC